MNDQRPIRLSKSRFLSGLQCAKRLYLEVHFPELADDIDPERQAIMDMGTEIGHLARDRFPQGILVKETYRQTNAALRRTEELVHDPTTTTIFEGAFESQGTLVRVDILDREEGSAWKLIEVKSTAKVKPVHMHDLAVQAEVLRGAGIMLTGTALMHVNTRYVYEGGDLDLNELFLIADMTEAVEQRRKTVGGQLGTMRQMLLEPSPPAIAPDGHCHSPYVCPFWGHCTKGKPSRWIYGLPGGKQTFHELQSKGIETIDEIPETVQLTVLQQRMKDNVEWMSDEFPQILRSVQYPVHHLDFEMFMPAIPPYPGTRPYRPIPIQWSNHIEEQDGTVRHETYLCRDAKDPREEIAMSVVKSVGEVGTICVYSENERHVLLSLAETCPALKEALHTIVDRLWDLLWILQEHYYHPDFQGSLSIKSVLPALVPHMAYDDLDVQNGAMASVVYRKMVFEEQDLFERSRMADNLIRYCARDTLGMLELRRVLLKKTAGVDSAFF
ncbi:MAG: DUF2779 domain-containing protein [Nitrospirales bacterium]|nr:DUF2779 domain-containing protein [Nitrospira sp.]MDR4503015.1 DUF2779 domain-containing protein [Nitrospirales bacterium]